MAFWTLTGLPIWMALARVFFALMGLYFRNPVR